MCSIRKYLKMQCHRFVFFLVFMCLWGWQYVIITPGMFFMSNNDLPCILGFLLEAETFNLQSANPNPAIYLRRKDAPAQLIIMTSFVGGAGHVNCQFSCFPCFATQLSKVIVYRRDQCLNFIYSDNLTMWYYSSPLRVCFPFHWWLI